MATEVSIYLCKEPDKVVYPVFNHNGFKGIITRNLSDVQKLKLITSKEYYEIESMIDSGSAIINGVNEYTIYSGKGTHADSKTLCKVPKEVFEEFHKLVNGIARPTIYAYIYEYTFKLDEEDYCNSDSGQVDIRDIINNIINKQNKSLSEHPQEDTSNVQPKEYIEGCLQSAISAMLGE